VTAVLLDNDAVAAVRNPGHAKHRVVLAHLEAVVARRKRGADVRVLVPTAVRVEAGWDRTEPTSAAINRFRVDDRPLDAPAANVAARLVADLAVSIADAHIGAVVRSMAGTDVAALTSDPDDVQRVSAPTQVKTVRI
jgi:hypothetical protein